MKSNFFFLLTILLYTTVGVYAQDETQAALKAMKRSIPMITDYTIYSYPTNNFGVGTSCRNKWVPKGVMVADMINSFGLDSIKDSDTRWRNVNGYAFYGTNPSALNITDSVTQNYGFQLLLPKILKVLSINIGFTNQRSRSFKLTIDSGVVRYLKYDRFMKYVKSDSNDALTQAYKDKKLIVATADFVILSYSIEITPTDTLGANIGAKLDSLLKIGKSFTLSAGDSLGLKYARQQHGNYKVSSNSPIVFAVKTMKQKDIAPQGIAKAHNFSDPDSPFEADDEEEIVEPKKVTNN
jgi:hypothetical protein